jgi:diaminobutyrate-2-oxoglutarate transaminase
MSEQIFVRHESVIRGYCNVFPAVFARAKGSVVHDGEGRSWIDFFVGAGTLNYGHSPEPVKQALIRYLEEDGILHALDMYTEAKAKFISHFAGTILEPRDLDYKLQFCGPTGTDAVEAALKLARKATGRRGIIAFMGSYHGMSLGALATTSCRGPRAAAGVALGDVTFLPFPTGFGGPFDSLDLFERMLLDPMSGVDKPAAVILETVQIEGGVQVASVPWLGALRQLCDRHGVLLIVDDIQAGCGRTGQFFSFERAGIRPDLVTVSKAIGGCGMPMALVLMRRDLDLWTPGEHTGTFRGNQLSFVAADAALSYWDDPGFVAGLGARAAELEAALGRDLQRPGVAVRGLGLCWTVDYADAGGGPIAHEIQRQAFARGLLVERCGRGDTAIKLMPPLTVTSAELRAGLERLAEAARHVLDVAPPPEARR